VKINQLIRSLLWTILLLLALDFTSATILFTMGVTSFKPPFEILIILYLGFRINSSILPILVLIIQFFHQAFSTDGWSLGTFTGVLICILLNYLRELIDISNKISTIIVVQICQILWFVFVTGIICMKMGDFGLFFSRLGLFLPESIFISLLSPFLFDLLNSIWKETEEGMAA